MALFLALCSTFDGILIFFNQYVDWYFGLVYILCLIPIYIAVFWFWKSLFSRSKEERMGNVWASVLVIGGVVLYTVWSLIYFELLYHHKYIYHGSGDIEEYGYYSYQSKKDFIIWTLVVATAWIAIFIYFSIASSQWADLGQ